MRKYRGIEISLLMLMVILFALSFFVSAGNGIGLLKERARQNSVVNGVRSIRAASDSVIDNLSGLARQCATDKYFSIVKQCNNNRINASGEKKLNELFRLGYYMKLESELGDTSDEICDRLEQFIRSAGVENVNLIRDNRTKLICVKDDSGYITAISIENVTFEYVDKLIGKREETINYDLGIPTALFFDENEELFNYSLVSGKGIYFTGATSSVIGNMYAGSHTKDEIREKEKEYGEVGIYGGINILSTQVGIEANHIISEGDININGSFVVLTSENNDIRCYARHLNSMEGFAKKSMYQLNGECIAPRDMDEEIRSEYSSYLAQLKGGFYRLQNIPLYYDSNNDSNYTGPYRKIISNVDVELTEDFTGLIMTPCNVIVNSDLNFEGLILCGDRIYVRGNNNIVANRGIALDIIYDEKSNKYEYEALDYIGGIIEKGIMHPKYYAVPRM